MMKINPEYGYVFLRVNIALVFIWFGVQQLYAPMEWTSFVPEFFGKFVSSVILVIGNGIVEVLFGMLLLSGFYVRFVAFVLAVHLFGIALSVGYNPIMVRDVGLACATFAVFLFGDDRWCLEKRYPA